MKTDEEWVEEWKKGIGYCTRLEFYRRIQDDALEAAALEAARWNCTGIADRIRAMKPKPPLPALLDCPFDGKALQVETAARQLYRVRCVMGCFQTPTFASELEAIEHANRRATP